MKIGEFPIDFRTQPGKTVACDVQIRTFLLVLPQTACDFGAEVGAERTAEGFPGWPEWWE